MTPLHYYLISIATPICATLFILTLLSLFLTAYLYVQGETLKREDYSTEHPRFVRGAQLHRWAVRTAIAAVILGTLFLLTPTSNTLLEMAKL